MSFRGKLPLFQLDNNALVLHHLLIIKINFFRIYFMSRGRNELKLLHTVIPHVWDALMQTTRSEKLGSSGPNLKQKCIWIIARHSTIFPVLLNFLNYVP